jgi:hypothetical protein
MVEMSLGELSMDASAAMFATAVIPKNEVTYCTFPGVLAGNFFV